MNKIGIAVIALAGAASSAMATTSFSPVMAPPSGERGHAFILGQTYGGTFTLAANGRDYTNGTIVAQRLIDKGTASPASLTTWTSGLPTDNAWVGPARSTLKLEAKYAAHNATFGYIDDSGSSTRSGPVTALFNTSSSGSTATVDMPADFRWTLKNNTTGRLFTSRQSDNVDGRNTMDHLITYRIADRSGNPYGQMQYMLFWEDLNLTDCTDKDYNDAVIRVTVVPAPGAAGLMACGGLVLARRRRR